MILKFNKLIKETEKAYLIEKNNLVTWIPKSQSNLSSKTNKIDIPDWLNGRLIWSENTFDINYVKPKDKVENIYYDDIDHDYYPDISIDDFEDEDIPF